MMATPLNVVQ